MGINLQIAFKTCPATRMFQWFTRVFNIGFDGPSDNPFVAIEQWKDFLISVFSLFGNVCQ